MKRLFLMLLLIGAAYALSACNFFSQPGDLQTENLANDLANTEIAAVRQTATVGADRLLVTLQFVETSVGIMQQQGTRIAATMVAAGMPIIDTSAITPIATANDPGATANPANNLVTPVISGQGAASGNITIQNPPTPTPLATSDPNVPRLDNILLAEQVGPDDCPLGASTTFSGATTDIYATAIAYNLSSANTLSSRWLRDGTEIARYDWTPNFNITQACIWFHLPSAAVEFVPGNWSVEITLDGGLVGSPINFTINADATGGADTSNSGG